MMHDTQIRQKWFHVPVLIGIPEEIKALGV